jgi:transposase InsO family protein
MSKRTYDHRIRNAIAKSGNPSLFPELNVPRTTAQHWIREGEKEIITTPQFTKTESELVVEVEGLKRELAQAKTKLALINVALMVSGFRLQYIRIASADLKEKLLDAISKTVAVLSIKEALETIGLSMARYRSWSKRQIQCRLSDEVSCPKLTPTKITTKERSMICSLVTSKKYLYFSIPSLALFAKRRRIVFASLTVWYRTVREFSLRRPGIRIYPQKPKVGIRAAAPNQIWHLDQSLLRLKNGTKVFIRAVVDNFSRCVLAWQVTDGYGGKMTKALIEDACRRATSSKCNTVPNVIVDSGTENLNRQVDQLIQSGIIKRTIAQLDISFSNSMIESFFRTIKHRWLFMLSLDDLASVRKHVGVFIEDYNTLIPHSALRGATPLEMYLGLWLPAQMDDLQHAEERAREERRIANLSSACGFCPT